MKTKNPLLFLVLICNVLTALSQTPQGFNYQAIARDSDGDPITGATIKVRLSVLTDTNGFYGGTGGTYLWEEEHSGVVTNSFGLFNIVLGSTSAVKVGGSSPSFGAIDWSLPNLFIGTKVANPTIYKVLGSSKLWSVPYSLRARESEQWNTSGANIYRPSGNVGVGTSSPGGRLVIESTPLWDDNIPLFEVKNKYGFPVLAVFNNGVRVLVEDLDGKGAKGGFAIGGFDPTKAGETVNLMMVSSDSIRFNIDNNPAKAKKGGFAIGSFDNSKAVKPRSFANVTPLSSDKGYYNTNLGYQSGLGNTTGYKNTFIGYQSGMVNSTGYRNVFIGDQSGSKNTEGYSNVFLGTGSGYSNTKGVLNVFIGENSGYSNTEGERNVFMGWYSGYSNVNGMQNVLIGQSAGRASNGSGNVFVGYIAGYSNLNGGNNVFIGYGSGYLNNNGNENVFIGNGSGNNNTLGSNNIAIGRASGTSNSTGHNNITIGYNANVPEGSTSNQIRLGNSSITYFGVQVSPTVSSDRKWKEEIRELPLGLNFVNGLKPVDYIRKNNTRGSREAGFIAQDVQELLDISGYGNGGILSRTSDGSLELRYNDFIPILARAIQEQQSMIEKLSRENMELRSELEMFRERLEAVEAAAGHK